MFLKTKKKKKISLGILFHKNITCCDCFFGMFKGFDELTPSLANVHNSRNRSVVN